MNATNIAKSSVPSKGETQEAAQAAQNTETKENASAPTKLYRVEELANAANISLSYVYAKIAKAKPRVYAKDGKSFLYSQEFLDQLLAQPRQRRSSKVKIIRAKSASNTEGTPARRMEDVVAMQQKARESNLSLLQRIDQLEADVSRLTKFLGV